MFGLKLDTQKRRAYALIGGGCSVLVFTIVTLFFAAEAARFSQQNKKLSEERALVDEQLARVESAMAKINAYSDSLDELTTSTVEGEAGFDDGTKTELANVREILERFKSVRASGEEAKAAIPHRLQDVAADSQRLEKTMRNLVSILSHRREVIDATPTITPARGWVSSFYGGRKSPFSGKVVLHRGMDIGAEPGTPVYATADGVVKVVTRSKSFGKFIILEHGYDTITKYAHNSKVLVTKGEKVKRGQQIALVGSTGRSTGPHLHYEVWVGGKAVDPKNYLLDRDLEVLDLVSPESDRQVGGEEIDFVSQKLGAKALLAADSAESSSDGVTKDQELEGKSRQVMGLGLLVAAVALLLYLVYGAFKGGRSIGGRSFTSD